MRFGGTKIQYSAWNLEFKKWSPERKDGLWRQENGVWSLQGCEGKEPGARRQPPMRVRFTSVSWSNILIDKRLTVACPNDMRQTGQAIEKKRRGLDTITYCYNKYA